MAKEELLHRFFQTMRNSHQRHEKPHRMSDGMRGEPIILYCIHSHGGRLSPSHISKDLNMSTAQIAAALRSLEKKGFVTKTPDDSDKRKSWIELTDEGTKFAEKRLQDMRDDATSMLDFLGEEDAENFIRILEKLQDWRPPHCE